MLTRIITTTSCGFELKVKAASNVSELLEVVDAEKAADLASAYVLAHSFLSKVRKVIAVTVANFTNLKKKTVVKNGKEVVAETDDDFVKRATVDLTTDEKAALQRAVTSALAEKQLDTLNYAVASRTAGGSLTKGLATYIKKAYAFWETAQERYRAGYIAKNLGTEDELDEEFDKDSDPEHIVKMAAYLKNIAEEAARAAEANAF
jgi:hypothetical protein